ncbi:MAG: aldo/keto reductase [Sideroxyarcus sp.]|nr:aldo/keto reductase [Sideroxyarcus sp.]
MSSVAILQARTNSSRLPGKVMLPIKGIPLAVLAAKRAANTGREIIVATSSEFSDDGLAELVKNHGLRCFRGSLENTLDRVVGALSSYDDSTIVFRLTADNVFPDGALLDEIEAEFLAKDVAYLCCNGEQSGLPYGMSVEVTRLGYLREAAVGNTNAYDQEHVTPYVIRKFGAVFFGKYKELKKGHFRCTIDGLDDYLGIQQVFVDVEDPVREPSLALVSRLVSVPFQPIASAPTPRLVLGTAQLGSDYGIANTTGQPDRLQCEELVKMAVANGVIYLDTARAYGNSEAMVGQSLRGGWEGRAKVITKLSPLQDCPQDASGSTLNAFVDASIYKSCSCLRVQKIEVLMLHRLSHLTDWSGGVWQRLMELQSAGLIGALGASVQNPDELSRALDVPDIRYIQLPFNLLDWRWDAIVPKILAAKASRKVTIHVRSALLQGLLTSQDGRHWMRANVEDAAPVKDWLLKLVAACRRVNVADLCLGYVNAMPWVDGIAIGMDNISQLRENIGYFTNPGLTEAQIDEIQNTRPRLGEVTLNPALWRKANP